MRKIGVMFRGNEYIYEFDLRDLSANVGDYVIVETENGPSIGKVVAPPTEVNSMAYLPPVLRIATPEDIAKDRENARLEKEAFKFCLKHIAIHKLEMKLLRVECLFDKSKLIFYYTADGRIDFRDLLKDLVRQFRLRIELRQIGVRDETQMLGGLGPCGRELCCATFLKKFVSVSIKMAKEQCFALNPEKISGLCGRLKCCLAYEYPEYQSFKQGLPPIGQVIKIDGTEGKVIRYNLPRQSVIIETQERQEIEIRADKLKDMLNNPS